MLINEYNYNNNTITEISLKPMYDYSRFTITLTLFVNDWKQFSEIYQTNLEETIIIVLPTYEQEIPKIFFQYKKLPHIYIKKYLNFLSSECKRNERGN